MCTHGYGFIVIGALDFTPGRGAAPGHGLALDWDADAALGRLAQPCAAVQRDSELRPLDRGNIRRIVDDAGSAVARDVPCRLAATVPSGVSGATQWRERWRRRECAHSFGRCAAQTLCGDAIAGEWDKLQL